ncbi:MAG: hypothetical protein ACP5O3_00010 [Candidatus Micrarchaeia archaeon]
MAGSKSVFRKEVFYAAVMIALAVACGFLAFQAAEAQQKLVQANLAVMTLSAELSSQKSFCPPCVCPTPSPSQPPEFNACTAVKDSSPLFQYYCKSKLFTEFVQASPDYEGSYRALDAANLTALAQQQPAVYANLSVTAFPVFEVRLASKTKQIGAIIIFDNNGKILKEVPLQMVTIQ